MKLNINGQEREVDVALETPLLWVLRDHLGMTGTKFGCGVGVCGACTVHLDGRAVRSCVMPVVAVTSMEIRTIEGLDHLVQAAWIEERVPQCGYCQSGQLMAAAALLAEKPAPTDADIDASMTNLCRCATYQRIRRGIHHAAAHLAAAAPPPATTVPAGVPTVPAEPAPATSPAAGGR